MGLPVHGNRIYWYTKPWIYQERVHSHLYCQWMKNNDVVAHQDFLGPVFFYTMMEEGDMLAILDTEEDYPLDCTGLSGSMPIILLAAKQEILDEGVTIRMTATDPETCTTVPMWCEFLDKKYRGPIIRKSEGTLYFIHRIRNLTEEERARRIGGE